MALDLAKARAEEKTQLWKQNKTTNQAAYCVALGFCVFFQRLALFPAVTYEDPPFSTGSHYLTCQVRNRFQGWKATQRSANFKPWSCQWSAQFWVPPEALLHLGSNRWCLASLGKEALGALLEEQAKGQLRQKEGPHWLVQDGQLQLQPQPLASLVKPWKGVGSHKVSRLSVLKCLLCSPLG